jgi:hypothetical protein
MRCIPLQVHWMISILQVELIGILWRIVYFILLPCSVFAPWAPPYFLWVEVTSCLCIASFVLRHVRDYVFVIVVVGYTWWARADDDGAASFGVFFYNVFWPACIQLCASTFHSSPSRHWWRVVVIDLMFCQSWLSEYLVPSLVLEVMRFLHANLGRKWRQRRILTDMRYLRALFVVGHLRQWAARNMFDVGRW